MRNAKKVFSFVFIISLLICSNGCGILKNITRTKDKVKTVTETFIDTNIVILFDTVPIYDTVSIYDTAKIENKTSRARSYWNPQINKIVLELQGKEFNVPIKLHKKEVIKKVKKETTKEPKTGLIIVFFVLFFTFCYFIIRFIINSIKLLKP